MSAAPAWEDAVMITCSTSRHIVDAISGPERGAVVPESTVPETDADRRGAMWRLVGLIWPWGRRRPETLEMAMSRLHEISPHLLEDIGVHIAPATGRAASGGKPALVVTLPSAQTPRPDKEVRPSAKARPIAAE